MMWLFLDKSLYTRFHDIIIPAENGTAQIDHILVSKYGVFIIETKNKQGWIFGSEDQANWTQVIWGKKYSFQNPLRQTYRQKKVLAGFLSLDERKIHPVIYFVGGSTFKTQMPENVISSGLDYFIDSYKDVVLSSDEVEAIQQKIDTHLRESTFSNSDHVRSLSERRNSTTICPKCGGRLKEKTAMKGPNSGSKFLGCESYPKCKFTRSV